MNTVTWVTVNWFWFATLLIMGTGATQCPADVGECSAPPEGGGVPENPALNACVATGVVHYVHELVVLNGNNSLYSLPVSWAAVDKSRTRG